MLVVHYPELPPTPPRHKHTHTLFFSSFKHAPSSFPLSVVTLTSKVRFLFWIKPVESRVGVTGKLKCCYGVGDFKMYFMP